MQEQVFVVQFVDFVGEIFVVIFWVVGDGMFGVFGMYVDLVGLFGDWVCFYQGGEIVEVMQYLEFGQCVFVFDVYFYYLFV